MEDRELSVSDRKSTAYKVDSPLTGENRPKCSNSKIMVSNPIQLYLG